MCRLFRFHLFGDAGVVLWLEGMRGSKVGRYARFKGTSQKGILCGH